MRKILIAGESQELFMVANQILNDKSEILNLSEEKTFENLFNQLNCCDEILAISDEFCGQVNSNLVRFFEWLKTQNFALFNEKKGLDGAEKTHSVVMSIAILSFDENFNQSILSDYFSRLSKYFGIKVNLLKCFNLRQNLLNLSDNYSSLANELLSCLNAKQGQNLNQKEVVIYTDGACSGNPGAGGWGAVLLCGESKRELSGFEAETTNNRMELTAVIEALKFLKKPCKVELYSDSAYVVNAINQNWLEKWKVNGWIGSDKKIVKNIELWQKLDELLEIHEVNFNKVKGHSSVELNNKCDQLATGEIAKHSSEN